MGTFYFFTGLRGRPRGRRLASSPRHRAVFAAHASLPKGVPRVTLCRMRATSTAVTGAFTQGTPFGSEAWEGGLRKMPGR